MIPILYESTETEFTSEGLGRLAECTRCVPVEGVNDIFECEFDYPVTGKLFKEIEVGRIIYATHDDTREPQPFDIYRKSEPIGGVVTFNARHISYRLNEVTVQPFTAGSCATALQGLKTNSIGTNPFTFSTDKNVSSPYEVKIPSSLRGLLGGQENSILDVYGKGEYKFDKWSVQLLTNRGTAKSTSIRYGKNLIDYTNEFDAGDTYNAVYPYWFGSVSEGEGEPQDTLVELPEKYITSGQGVPSGRTVIVPMDLSQDFQEPPTVEELRTLATTRLANSDAWTPAQTITIDFVALWQTEEYKDFEPVQHVNLCDTISVVMPMYGTSYRTKVIRTEYNTLLDRYDKLELGTKPDNLAGIITASLGRDFNSIQQDVQAARARADYAVNIAGDENQYFWFKGSGDDTGAHITQVERDTFEADPTMGGGNLLARSNGIAARDGLIEIAAFGTFGQRMCNSAGIPYFVMEAGSSTTLFHATAGPFPTLWNSQTESTSTGVLPGEPVSGQAIVVNISGNATTFAFVAGTADTQETSRQGNTFKLQYDGQKTLTLTVTGGMEARISFVYYYVYTYEPMLAFGSYYGGRGGFSATFGEGLKTEYRNQFACGMYNENLPDDMFEVGGGSADGARKTLFAVEAGGDAYCAGSITASGHETPIGTRIRGSGTATVANSSSLGKVADIATLPAGSWAVTVSVRFTASTTGSRGAHIVFDGSTAGESYVSGAGEAALQAWSMTAYYSSNSAINCDLYARQSSGSSMSVPYYWCAMRIA